LFIYTHHHRRNKELAMATASLVLGIIAVAVSGLCFCVPFFGQILPVLLGIMAIIFGAIGRKNQPAKATQAKAGLVMGIIGVAVPVVLLLVYAAVGVAATLDKPFDWKLLKPKDI
jgi:uncharacterized membrane protein HdeD (DUF308 family)